MKLVSGKGKYFLPHTTVVKYATDQLKLRVVFDASVNSTYQFSLNKLLYINITRTCSQLTFVKCTVRF